MNTINELKDLLDTINLVIWFFDAICLYLFFHICRKSTKVCSSFVTMIVVFIVSWLMMGYQGVLDAYIKNHPEFNPVVNFCWYMGFATFYILALAVLRKAHEFAKIKIATLGHYISWSFFILACIELAQYAEIIIFKTDANMDAIYRIGIPTINIASTVVSLSLGVIAVYYLKYNKKGLEGLKRWTI